MNLSRINQCSGLSIQCSDPVLTRGHEEKLRTAGVGSIGQWFGVELLTLVLDWQWRGLWGM
jgi:hypothetical protein